MHFHNIMYYYGGIPRFMVGRMRDTAFRLMLRAMRALEEPQFSVERMVQVLYPEPDVAPSRGPGAQHPEEVGCTCAG